MASNEQKAIEHRSADIPLVTMRYFDNWKSVHLACAVCKWKGIPDPDSLKDNDSVHYPFMSFHCPCCGKPLLVIEQSATTNEALANIDKLAPKQRADIQDTFKRQADFAACRLNSPDQLPDLDFENRPNKLLWDLISDAEGKLWNIILHTDQVIWRQPAIWEGFSEFSRIAAIIRERYGNAICDLGPTENSKMYLGGDALWSDAVIERARRSLGWTRLS
jgi:hypothetical protein